MAASEDTSNLRQLIEQEVAAQLQLCDPNQELSSVDYANALVNCTDGVLGVMQEEEREVLNKDDRISIVRCIQYLVQAALGTSPQPLPKLRFDKFDRVLCNVGGGGFRQWASGTIMAIYEDDPMDPTGQTQLPYVVKTDPPVGRLVSVPKDAYTVCRAEVCFGQRAGALWFTLYAKPQSLKPGTKRRFAVGERVACAIEDESDDYSVWSAGTVLDVDYSIEADAKALHPEGDYAGAAGIVPYRVELDSGCKVLVHRDEHWLVRSLAQQPTGPRQAADGTRNLKRLEKRRRDDEAWEVIDHATGKVRSSGPPDSDSDED